MEKETGKKLYKICNIMGITITFSTFFIGIVLVLIFKELPEIFAFTILGSVLVGSIIWATAGTFKQYWETGRFFKKTEWRKIFEDIKELAKGLGWLLMFVVAIGIIVLLFVWLKSLAIAPTTIIIILLVIVIVNQNNKNR
jgi:hypothetical protein